MSGDYSRISHDALRRYSALLLQQGRVLLDADFNELVDILKDRIEKLSLDAMGNPGIPFLTNPDAFLITPLAGPTDLAVTPGRIYVDGLMAEVFGGEAFTYLGQPFLPDPPDLPEGDAAIYLCLWEEELTWVEAPLLDPALGGVDTTTRTRTVVQLFVDEVDTAECGLDVGPPPSAGRLTSRAIAPPAPDDPCILPPASGYRGLENRLYRVEVHDAGALGTARFKWSRDNGSIQVPVEAISVNGTETSLTVPRIGRDPVMRFVTGDWVTITDDHREWMDEPGVMAQVVDTVEADGIVIVDRDITAVGRPFGGDAAALAERHTRLRKWDQTAETNPGIDADGLIATDAGPIPLEDGIEIEFSTDPAGGEFRRGDYWVFWARTATATIEELTDEPPRGIIRHHVQLAAASGLGTPDPTITDCRPQPDPGAAEGCCTVVVRPGDSIQDAIDALPDEGGCICLKAGVHPVPGTLTLNRDNVHLHGESPGAILQGAAPLLQMGTSAASIRIEMVDFLARVPDQGPGAILTAGGATDLTIEDCRFAPFPGTTGGIAMQITRTDRLRLSGNAIFGTDVGIVISGLSANPVIENNAMVFGFDDDRGGAATGIWIVGNPSAAMIEDNVILGAHQGIIVNDDPFGIPRSASASTVIADNIVFTGSLRGDRGSRAVAIDAAADFSLVRGNNLFVGAPLGVGIRATGSGSTIGQNNIGAVAGDAAPAVGIQVGDDTDDGAMTNGVTVESNQIAGELTGVVVLRTSGAAVTGSNILSLPAGSTGGIVAGDSPLLRISGNRIAGSQFGILSIGGQNTRIAGNDIIGSAAGIFVDNDVRPTVVSNHAGSCGFLGIATTRCLGRTEVIENAVTNAGAEIENSIGIGAAYLLGEWHVEANEVADTGIGLDGESASTRAVGIWGSLILEARIESNLVTYSNVFDRDPAREDRALQMLGLFENVVTFGSGQFVFGFPVQILGNKFIGAGASALVELAQFDVSDMVRLRFERVQFSDNYCLHLSRAPSDAFATVVLRGRACSVTGNQVKATVDDYFSFDFNGMPGPFVGNVTTGGALGYPAFTPAPDGLHNMII